MDLEGICGRRAAHLKRSITAFLHGNATIDVGLREGRMHRFCADRALHEARPLLAEWRPRPGSFSGSSDDRVPACATASPCSIALACCSTALRLGGVRKQESERVALHRSQRSILSTNYTPGEAGDGRTEIALITRRAASDASRLDSGAILAGREESARFALSSGYRDGDEARALSPRGRTGTRGLGTRDHDF